MRANERTDERVAQYLRLYSCLFQTTVARPFVDLLADWWTHLLLYLDTPEVKFFLHVFTFSFYLLVFAYLILSASGDFALQAPSSTEWLLIAYWLSFFAHEMKQFYRGDVKSLIPGRRRALKSKLLSYWDSLWNRIDIFLLLYFVFMMSARWYVVAQHGPGHADPVHPDVGVAPPAPPAESDADDEGAPPMPAGSLMNTVRLIQHSAGATAEAHYVFVLNLYSFYFVFWCLRILQLFAVSESLGPKLIMIRLMIDDVLKIFLYIMIFAVAYAVWLKVAIKTVSREFLVQGQGGATIEQGLNETAPLAATAGDAAAPTIVDYLLNIQPTDVVYFVDDLISHPFWHLFGESFIDAYDQYLPKKNETTAYAYGYRVTMILFLAPLMRIIYVLITVVLLLNLMIAIFQYSIDLVQAQADRNWNIYRKAVIFEYHNRAILPAPLSLLLDVGVLFVLCFRKVTGSRRHVSVIQPSPRFDCSTLKIRVEETPAGTEDHNPYVDWLDYIRKWEKMMQNHHSSVAGGGGEETGGDGGGGGGGGGGRIKKYPVSADSLRIVEMREEIRKLQLEILKLSGLQASTSSRLSRPTSTASLNDLYAQKKRKEDHFGNGVKEGGRAGHLY